MIRSTPVIQAAALHFAVMYAAAIRGEEFEVMVSGHRISIDHAERLADYLHTRMARPYRYSPSFVSLRGDILNLLAPTREIL